MVNSARPLSVSELNRQVRHLLETRYGNVCVEGEISNFKASQAGHWYFTLKDNQAEVSCAIFRGQNQRLSQPADGTLVRLEGRISLYEVRGQYQLIANAMESAGAGALMQAFEKLKDKLRREGLFDEARKRPIPLAPQRVAVITSSKGAALQDIISVFGQRAPATEIIVIPSPVQGSEAVPALRQALERAHSADIGIDCIVIGRGGGSIEDLWAFNDEALARDIAASPLPVISAVGHETDFTIADFVADKRAETPTAAAALLSEYAQRQLASTQQLKHRLALLGRQLLAQHASNLALLQQRLASPMAMLQSLMLRLDDTESVIQSHMKDKINSSQHRLAQFQAQLHHPADTLKLWGTRLTALQDRLVLCAPRAKTLNPRLNALEQQLNALNPKQVLNRGYAMIWDESNTLVRDHQRVSPGQRLKVQVRSGKFPVKVQPK